MEKGTILIVDDDPLVRGVLSDIFSPAEGYATECAEDGREGIGKLLEHAYDIIFTDLTMPGMTGIDFLREAKKIKPSLPVVVITGHSTMENAINAMKEGARDFITKPFNVRTVMSVADRILGETRLLGKIFAQNDYETFIGRLNSELFKKLQEINVLQSVTTELDELSDNKEVYGRVVEMASRLLRVQEASFGIVENGILRIKHAIGAPEQDIPIAGTLIERVLQTGKYHVASFGETNPHTGAPLTSPFFSIPFAMNNEVFGIINLSKKGDGASFTEDEISLALTFAKKAAQRIENNALYEVFYNNLINTLRSLVISIEARDSYTKQHSERVTAYALQIAEVMELAPEDKDALRFGGYLHDIGKIGVRDTVLTKPTRLTPEETAEIRLHPVIGGNIIKPIRFFPRERDLILHHHENFDGSGYPDGLAGEAIPLIARVLAVADAYDAMTSSRPYREALTHARAVDELTRCSDSQFDSRVVRAFLQTPAGKGDAHGN